MKKYIIRVDTACYVSALYTRFAGEGPRLRVGLTTDLEKALAFEEDGAEHYTKELNEEHVPMFAVCSVENGVNHDSL